MRNLDRWRAFAGIYSVEMPADAAAISNWLDSQGLPVNAHGLSPHGRAAVRGATPVT